MTDTGINLDVDPDQHPKDKAAADDEEEELRDQEWSYYFMPPQATRLLTGRFFTMGSFVLVYYLLQLVACIGVVNFYSDVSRFEACGG